MRKRLILLFLIFVALYFLLHIAYDLPKLVNEYSKFAGLPGMSGWLASLRDPAYLLFSFMDVVYNFLFALVPYLLLHRFYPRRLLLAIGIMLVSIPVMLYGGYIFTSLRESYPMRLRFYFLSNILYVFIYLIYGLVFFFIRYAQHKELEQKDMVIQNRQSELSFLRSQINPHFLFNSLHNIYSLMYQNAAGAQEAILSLSDLLRYMLYDASEKVPLQKEIDYIARYIELQKIRFDHVIHAPMHVTGDTAALPIAPLLLIPFVENAFKHGDFSGDQEGVEITIHAGPRSIYFHCVNPKGQGLKDAAGGIGLQNVQRRLALLYPDKHTLKIDNADNHFTINLELINE